MYDLVEHDGVYFLTMEFIDGISLADQRITTLVLTTTPGGVLVNSLFVDQKNTVAAVANPSARIRLVAGAAANGVAAATINGSVPPGPATKVSESITLLDVVDDEGLQAHARSIALRLGG
mgnify:CR=1 FL=1